MASTSAGGTRRRCGRRRRFVTRADPRGITHPFWRWLATATYPRADRGAPALRGAGSRELFVGAVVAVVAGTADVRAAIGFSSFAVLVYYAIANVSAWTLHRDERRPPRAVPALGLIGRLVLAFALPARSVITGVAMLAVGAAVYGIRMVVARY